MVTPWVIGVVFVLCLASDNRGVAKRQQATYGRITAHEPSNHNRYGFKFSVNGKPYTGWDSPAHDYEIGQQVLVYYDPQNPNKDALTDFSEQANQNSGFVALLASGILIIAALAVVRRARYKAR